MSADHMQKHMFSDFGKNDGLLLIQQGQHWVNRKWLSLEQILNSLEHGPLSQIAELSTERYVHLLLATTTNYSNLPRALIQHQNYSADPQK